jgi:diguanylate cyclase (GGDEF)-like protein
MISLKKYLDMDPSKTGAGQAVTTKLGAGKPEAESDTLTNAVLESYRSALLAVGNNGARACPHVGATMQHALASLEDRLPAQPTAALIRETEIQVEQQLGQWGECSADYFKTKATEVKELLIVLARTAESMGQRDQRYASHFDEFKAQLQNIADLEDLAQIRSSLVRQATELKTYVDQMAQDSREAVTHLKSEVTTYETKLKAAEKLAAQDPLTSLVNRRKIEELIEWRITHQQVFCVVILDLNRFKQVNDTHGHAAGDNLLQQFSQELRSNIRSNDIAGRWGGDEFLVILDCNLDTAKVQVERLQKWVLGEYTLKLAPSSKEAKVKIDASIGVVQWQMGQTVKELVASADSAMYRAKAVAAGQKA